MIQFHSMNHLLESFLKLKLRSIKHGRLLIDYKDVYRGEFGENIDNITADLKINNLSFFFDIIFKGEIGFAEAYIHKKWETTDLAALLKFFLINQQLNQKNTTDNFFYNFFKKIKFNFKSNSILQAKKNIKYHYDLGNEFYSLWLDPSMTYSSALFKNKDDDLHIAQNNKYDSIIENLDVNNKDHILEIGSGWGGFINRNFEKTKSKVDSLTISKEQFRYVNEKITKNNFENSKVIFNDYRVFNKINSYDKIVSIEMFEAVGKEYWNIFFKKINELLKKGGKAAFQIITISDKYYHKYSKDVDFIQKYIFPGGILPSKEILYELFKKYNLKLNNEISFGNCYAKTLHIWKDNFNKKWNTIKNLNFDEKFKNLWNYYLNYCQIGFESKHTDVSQFYVEKTA